MTVFLSSFDDSFLSSCFSDRVGRSGPRTEWGNSSCKAESRQGDVRRAHISLASQSGSEAWPDGAPGQGFRGGNPRVARSCGARRRRFGVPSACFERDDVDPFVRASGAPLLPGALHPDPWTLNSAPGTRHPAPCTLHPQPRTPNPAGGAAPPTLTPWILALLVNT